jgi:hypothetical protein
LTCSLPTIKTCIANNLPVPVCDCGKTTSYRKSTSGKVSATTCSIKCRSNNQSYKDSLSDAKTRQYSDPAVKKNIEAKKIATCTSNHGVPYPMQSAHIHEKHQKSSMQSDSDGLRGYEPLGLEYLTNLYRHVIVGSTYMKDNSISISWKDADNKIRRSFPDFFVKDIKCFVEIKSEYTRVKDDYKIMKCKDTLKELGYAYAICTITPSHKFNQKRLTKFVWEMYNDELLENI